MWLWLRVWNSHIWDPHEVTRKERGPFRLQNCSGQWHRWTYTLNNMTQPPPTMTSNKSNTKASLCACLLWESYALSGSTPMTTCLFYIEYPKLGHMDSKTVAPPSLSFNKPGWLVLAWPLMKIASVNKDIQETIASTLEQSRKTQQQERMVLKWSWWRNKTKQEQYWLQPFPTIQK